MAPPNDSRKTGISPFTLMGIVGLIVGAVTLGIVGLAVFCGLWLDRQLGTKLIFTFVLVLGSAPLALAITYRMARWAMKFYNFPPPAGGKGMAHNINNEKGGEEE